MCAKLAMSQMGTVLLLLAVGIGVVGCQRNQPPPPNPAPEATQPYHTSFSASGWSYHLRPLKPGAPADADKAKEAWSDLFQGMAKDPKTRDLLTRLHAGLPVEFVVLDAKQAEDKSVLTAPPPEGFAVAIRVAGLSQKEEGSNRGTVPVRVIAYGRAILIKDTASNATPDSWDKLADNMKKEPSPGEPLYLAMEDYIIRHAPGWSVRGGPVFASEDKKLPSSVEEQRRAVDESIRSYADHAKAYYGALRKQQ